MTEPQKHALRLLNIQGDDRPTTKQTLKLCGVQSVTLRNLARLGMVEFGVRVFRPGFELPGYRITEEGRKHALTV